MNNNNLGMKRSISTPQLGQLKSPGVHPDTYGSMDQHPTRPGAGRVVKKDRKEEKRRHSVGAETNLDEEMLRILGQVPMLALPGWSMEAALHGWSMLEREVQDDEESMISSIGVLLPKIKEQDRYTAPLLFAVMAAALGAFQFGYNVGVLNTPADEIKRSLLGNGTEIPEVDWSLIVSTFAIGGLVGSYIGGAVSDRYGRKTFLLLNSLVFATAGLLEFFSHSVWMMVLGRFIVGCGSGGSTVVVPLYLGEISPAPLRGALGTMNQLSIVIGILVANLLGKPFGSDPQWRYLLAAVLVPSGIQLMCGPFMVESPRWLCFTNRVAEAQDVLVKLRAKEDVSFDMSCMVAAQDAESGARQPSIRHLFTDKTVRIQVIVGIGLQLAQQLSGINAVFFYSSSFFKNAGQSDPYIGTVLASTVNVLSTGAAVYLMDRLGRRILLLLSAAGMFVSCIVLTIALELPGHYGLSNTSLGYVSIASVLTYVIFFEFGLGPIPWLIVAEIFPAEHRGSAMSVCAGVNWICTFAVGLGFPLLSAALGKVVFVPFAVVLALTFYLSYRRIPETKGRTLEEIEEEFANMRKF